MSPIWMFRRGWGTYSKHAEVTVPSLDDWEKEWNDKTTNHGRRMTAPKLVAVDFRSQAVSMAQAN